VAAAIWLVQQPLDKRVFDWPHDDAELLGRLTGVGPRLGAVMHLGNGALFGAVYAARRPRSPSPPRYAAPWPACSSTSRRGR